MLPRAARRDRSGDRAGPGAGVREPAGADRPGRGDGCLGLPRARGETRGRKAAGAGFPVRAPAGGGRKRRGRHPERRVRNEGAAGGPEPAALRQGRGAVRPRAPRRSGGDRAHPRESPGGTSRRIAVRPVAAERRAPVRFAGRRLRSRTALPLPRHQGDRHTPGSPGPGRDPGGHRRGGPYRRSGRTARGVPGGERRVRSAGRANRRRRGSSPAPCSRRRHTDAARKTGRPGATGACMPAGAATCIRSTPPASPPRASRRGTCASSGTRTTTCPSPWTPSPRPGRRAGSASRRRPVSAPGSAAARGGPDTSRSDRNARPGLAPRPARRAGSRALASGLAAGVPLTARRPLRLRAAGRPPR